MLEVLHHQHLERICLSGIDCPEKGQAYDKYKRTLADVLLPDEMNLGFISDLDERLRTHNSGGSPHTAEYRPWKIVLHLCFQDEHRAVEFERYLKSGSGHAFAKKRFW